MSVQNLLRNLVTEAQLNQQQSLRSQKMKELAAAAPRGQAARIAAPSPIVRSPNNSLGQGMSALGKALGDIGQMKKERAAKDAFGAMYEPTMVTDGMGGATAMPTSPKGQALMRFAIENSGTKAGESALRAAQLTMQAENQQATRQSDLEMKKLEIQRKNLPKLRAAATFSAVSPKLGEMVSSDQMEIKTAGQIAANPNALKMFNDGNMAGALQAANIKIGRTVEVEKNGERRIVGITDNGTQIDIGPAALVPGRDKPSSPEVQAQKVEIAGAAVMQKGLVQQELDKLDRAKKSSYALETIDEAMLVLNTGEATGSVLGNVFDNLAAVIGVSTKGAQATGKLKLLQATLMLQQPRMEGPQSDKDVMLYRDAAAQIGDPNTPVATRVSALKTLKSLHKKYAPKDVGDGPQPVNSSAPPPPPGFVPVQ